MRKISGETRDLIIVLLIWAGVMLLAWRAGVVMSEMLMLGIFLAIYLVYLLIQALWRRKAAKPSAGKEKYPPLAGEELAFYLELADLMTGGDKNVREDLSSDLQQWSELPPLISLEIELIGSGYACHFWLDNDQTGEIIESYEELFAHYGLDTGPLHALLQRPDVDTSDFFATMDRVETLIPEGFAQLSLRDDSYADDVFLLLMARTDDLEKALQMLQQRNVLNSYSIEKRACWKT